MEQSPPRGGSGKGKEPYVPDLQVSPKELGHEVSRDLHLSWAKEAAEEAAWHLTERIFREEYLQQTLREFAYAELTPINGHIPIAREVYMTALEMHPTVRLCDLLHEHDKWYKLLACAESKVRLCKQYA